jgi:hypothetical protein
MKNEQIYEILDKVRSVRFKDNVVTPVTISEIPELEDMGSYKFIMNELQTGRLSFNLPNHLIHDTYSLISSKRHKRFNNFTFQFPFIYTLIIVIYGLLIGNYWLLSLIPVLFISQVSSSIFGGKLLYGILLLVVIYFFYNSNYTLGIVFSNILISIYFSHQVRNQRRSFLMKLCLINEELFCFIFFSRSLKINDNRSGKNIYFGMN